MSSLPPLVLASTSQYRKQLLARLTLDFQCFSPNIDETPRIGETFSATALRLAMDKAFAGRSSYPNAIIIGSDQVASCNGRRLDKPGSHDEARAQLLFASGQTALFQTAVCVLDASSARHEERLVECRVTYRKLKDAEIEHYLLAEKPYDCAGSAKSEGLGIVLMQKVECNDPTALIGLPLIAVTDLLVSFGRPPLGGIDD